MGYIRAAALPNDPNAHKPRKLLHNTLQATGLPELNRATMMRVTSERDSSNAVSGTFRSVVFLKHDAERRVMKTALRTGRSGNSVVCQEPLVH